mgnify:CR=1 FL=1
MNKKISSWIYQFSFFEHMGLVTFGTIITNYYLNKPLISIGFYLGCCGVFLTLSILKLYLNYTKFSQKQRKS